MSDCEVRGQEFTDRGRAKTIECCVNKEQGFKLQLTANTESELGGRNLCNMVSVF